MKVKKIKVFKSFEEYKDEYFPRNDTLNSLLDKPDEYGKEVARRAIKKARKILNKD